MNIGDYVRTPNGVIAKIIDIKDNEGQYFINNNVVSLSSKTYISDKNITIGENFKHSPNIIDLIEVGDYVNGSRVLDIAQAPKKAIYLLEKDNHCALIPRMKKDIKSIVTKEQFESMEYKL